MKFSVLLLVGMLSGSALGVEHRSQQLICFDQYYGISCEQYGPQFGLLMTQARFVFSLEGINKNLGSCHFDYQSSSQANECPSDATVLSSLRRHCDHQRSCEVYPEKLRPADKTKCTRSNLFIDYTCRPNFIPNKQLGPSRPPGANLEIAVKQDGAYDVPPGALANPTPYNGGHAKKAPKKRIFAQTEKEQTKSNLMQPILIGLVATMILLIIILGVVMLVKRNRRKKRASVDSNPYQKVYHQSGPPNSSFSEIYSGHHSVSFPPANDAGLLKQDTSSCLCGSPFTPHIYDPGYNRHYEMFPKDGIYNHSNHGSVIYPLHKRSSSGIGTSVASQNQLNYPGGYEVRSPRGDSVEGNSNEAVSESSHSTSNYPPLALLHCPTSTFVRRKSTESLSVLEPPESFKTPHSMVNGITLEPTYAFNETDEENFRSRAPDGNEDIRSGDDLHLISVPALGPLRINYDPNLRRSNFPSMAC